MRASILAVALVASAVCFATGAAAQAVETPSADPSASATSPSLAAAPGITDPTAAASATTNPADDSPAAGSAADTGAPTSPTADPSTATSPAADPGAVTGPAADPSTTAPAAAAGAANSPGTAGNAASAPPSVAAPAGVSGRIVTPGRCPVPLGDGGPACPDRPFPTTVLILTPDGQPVASVPTATDGTFAVALRPGRYGVNPILADGNPPASGPISVEVPGDELVPLTIVVQGGAAAARVP